MAKANPAQTADVACTVRLLNDAATHPEVIKFANQEGFGVRAGVAATDYAVARFMGVTSQAVSNWRNSGLRMGPSRVLALCMKLEMPLGEINQWLCDFEYERARKPEQKVLWQQYKRLVTKGLSAVILPFLLGFPMDVEALSAYDKAADDSVIYIMLNRLWRRFCASFEQPSQLWQKISRGCDLAHAQ